MDMTAAALVRQARLSRQLSMSALADLAGVPKSTVSRIEAGKIDATVSMLSRLLTAAGFRFESQLAEVGTDEPFAAILGRLAESCPAERERWLARFPAVAATALVARRAGARRVELPGGIAQAVELLTDQGQGPVVSVAEAVLGSLEPTRSFVPVIYVDDPSTVQGFSPAGRQSYQAMFLLPLTANVRAFARWQDDVRFVSREWGVLDTLASPGRQAEIGQELLRNLFGQ
jgi:transcriptional regulator with XRE-family HTH domain